MSIIKLKSSNPNLSHIIGKNPENGMVGQRVRKGAMFGWFPNNNTQEYAILFQDGLNEMSYANNEDEQYEYLDRTRYSSPVIVLNAITEFYRTTLNKPHELDSVNDYEHSLIVNLEIQKVGFVKRMLREVGIVNVTYTNMAGHYYKVEFTTKENISTLLHFVNVFCIFVAMTNGIYMNITTSLLKKYIKSLNVIQATYYMRYLFMTKIIVSGKMFKEVKDELEKLDGVKLELQYGNTAEWRRDFVAKRINYDKPIIDIGCGEGFYTLSFAKKLRDKPIHAIDINPECIDKVQHRAESRNLDNVFVYNELTNYIETNDTNEKVDFLLMEVLEHMEKEDAKSLLSQVIKLNFDKVFISTPTKEFNKHYFNTNEETRHEDHHWEATVPEFLELIDSVLESSDDKTITYQHYMIGDLVDGVAPSQGVILKHTLV